MHTTCTQNVAHVAASTVCRLEPSKKKELACEEPSRSEQTSSQPQKELFARAKVCWARAQEAAVQAMRAEEGAQHSRPSPIKKQCAPKREIGDCAKKSESAE